MSEQPHSTMRERVERLAENLQEQFGPLGCELLRGHGELTLVVPTGRLLKVAKSLRDQEAFCFAELIDVCGVDYATYGETEWQARGAANSGFGRGVERPQVVPRDPSHRFAAVYHLLSVSNNQRLRLRVFVDEQEPIVPSVVTIWNCANWFEREAFDLFGILFDGHPDLRRILTDYGFIGHPFRKEFPLIGQVEMRYDPEQRRVVYEPVSSVQPRTLVPRVARDDNRYLQPRDAAETPGETEAGGAGERGANDA